MSDRRMPARLPMSVCCGAELKEKTARERFLDLILFSCVASPSNRHPFNHHQPVMALATLIMWPLGSLVRGLPYLVAVCWILTAALYDVNVVLQQSLFLVAYFYLTNLLERLLARYLKVDTDRLLFSSFINTSALAILVVGFLGLSPFAFLKPSSSNSSSSSVGSVLLSAATFSYALFLQLVEPVLMFIEMVMVIRLILAIGERLREKVYEGSGDEEDSSSSLYKGIVIVGTALNYGLSLAGTIYLCKQESHLFAL